MTTLGFIELSSLLPLDRVWLKGNLQDVYEAQFVLPTGDVRLQNTRTGNFIDLPPWGKATLLDSDPPAFEWDTLPLDGVLEIKYRDWVEASEHG